MSAELRIDVAALNAVYCVTIAGEPYRVTGSRNYCERRAAEARKIGRKVGKVRRLTEAVA